MQKNKTPSTCQAAGAKLIKFKMYLEKQAKNK